MIPNARRVLKSRVRRPQDSTGTPTVGRVNDSLLSQGLTRKPATRPTDESSSVSGKTNTTDRLILSAESNPVVAWHRPTHPSARTSSTSTARGANLSQRTHNNSNATIPRRPTTKTPALRTPGPCRPRSTTTSHQLMNIDRRRHTQLVAQTAHKHFDSFERTDNGGINRGGGA